MSMSLNHTDSSIILQLPKNVEPAQWLLENIKKALDSQNLQTENVDISFLLYVFLSSVREEETKSNDIYNRDISVFFFDLLEKLEKRNSILTIINWSLKHGIIKYRIFENMKSWKNFKLIFDAYFPEH